MADHVDLPESVRQAVQRRPDRRQDGLADSGHARRPPGTAAQRAVRGGIRPTMPAEMSMKRAGLAGEAALGRSGKKMPFSAANG
jgi:hypothetical protein